MRPIFDPMLVENYPTDFTIDAWEIDPEERLRGARFRCHARFQREPLEDRQASAGVLLDESAFRVRAAFLDHRPRRARHGAHERNFVLEELKSPVLQLVPGEKICYVTDVVYHDRNAGRIAELEGARAGQC